MTELDHLRDEVRKLSLELGRLAVEVQTASLRSRLLLSPDELAEITGYRRMHLQCQELKRRGWRFEVSSGGAPVVARAYAEARLGGQPAPLPRVGPRWDLMKK